MSLKAFHILFVIITTLLCVFLAVWGLNYAPTSVAPFARKIGFAGIAGAVILPIYGFYFYGKVKNFSSNPDS